MGISVSTTGTGSRLGSPLRVSCRRERNAGEIEMAQVILVHAIANEREAADTIEGLWLPALAGGVRTAGFPSIADKLWPNGAAAGGFEARAAFYGNLFRPRGAQGPAVMELGAGAQKLADELALEWLQRAATRSTSAEQRTDAEREFRLRPGSVCESSKTFAASSAVSSWERSKASSCSFIEATGAVSD